MFNFLTVAAVLPFAVAGAVLLSPGAACSADNFAVNLHAEGDETFIDVKVTPDGGLRSNRKQYRSSMWEQKSECCAERDSATATALNGKIYVTGAL